MSSMQTQVPPHAVLFILIQLVTFTSSTLRQPRNFMAAAPLAGAVLLAGGEVNAQTAMCTSEVDVFVNPDGPTSMIAATIGT